MTNKCEAIRHGGVLMFRCAGLDCIHNPREKTRTLGDPCPFASTGRCLNESANADALKVVHEDVV
jgi:hypothetical protein